MSDKNYHDNLIRLIQFWALIATPQQIYVRLQDCVDTLSETDLENIFCDDVDLKQLRRERDDATCNN